jgi:NitT/TauT family transport system ATP-binding protein
MTRMDEPVLRVTGLGKRFGQGSVAVEAIRRLDFEVARRELVCVVGPSGSGKTTLLRCVSGLLAPTCGTVVVDGRPVAAPNGDIAVVFQDYTRSLLPWMSVTDNVLVALHALGPDERRRRADDALGSVGLADAGGRYPWELSGGMQQRVALARALAYRPRVMLMDEPFAAVDAQTRAGLQDLTLRLRDEHEMTILFVTHDIDEAVYLGDRVVVLTRAPTEVAEVVDIGLDAARSQLVTKQLPAYAELRAHVLGLVRGSVSRVAA